MAASKDKANKQNRQRREVVRSIRFSPAEWEAIQAAAEREALPVITWVRSTLSKSVRPPQ